MSNFGYSRRRAKSKGAIAPPTERVAVDQVTGELVVTPLDHVQKAFERVRQVYDTWRLTMSAGDLERLADMVILMVMRTRRHRERDVEALRAMLAAAGGAA